MTSRIYKALCPLAVERDFELRRFYGSSSMLTRVPDHYFLIFMSIHEGAISRKLGRCIITCAYASYLFVLPV